MEPGKLAGGTWERNGSFESGELEGSVPPDQNGSAAFRMRHFGMGQGWFSGSGCGGGRGREAFYLQGIWADLRRGGSGPWWCHYFSGVYSVGKCMTFPR